MRFSIKGITNTLLLSCLIIGFCQCAQNVPNEGILQSKSSKILSIISAVHGKIHDTRSTEGNFEIVSIETKTYPSGGFLVSRSSEEEPIAFYDIHTVFWILEPRQDMPSFPTLPESNKCSITLNPVASQILLRCLRSRK